MKWNWFRKKDTAQDAQPAAPVAIDEKTQDSAAQVLTLKNIRLNQPSVDKAEAIRMAGQILVDAGYVLPAYIDAMLEREQVITTYIGEGVAIPHGVGTSKDLILKSGISVIQFPQGVHFGENMTAYLVIGIAGTNNEHLSIISNLAKSMQDEEAFQKLFTTDDAGQIHRQLTSKM